MLKYCRITFLVADIIILKAIYKALANKMRWTMKGVLNYFGGARSKGFATLRNVSKLQFFDKIGQAKSVVFRFYSAI